MLKIRNAEVLDNIVIVCSSAYMEGYSGCGECVLHEFMRKGYGLCRGVCVCVERCVCMCLWCASIIGV